MKRTEKDIYDFVNRKLEEATKECSHETNLYMAGYNYGQKEAYHEVLNFIGTIRTKGE